MKNKMLFTLFLLFSISLKAQNDSNTVDQSFLIIQSTKSYNAALRKAQAACNKLGVTLNLNGNYADKEKGLTNSHVCACGLQHGYIPRGRGVSGNFISIEYSSAFEGTAEGYYLIVVSSGSRENIDNFLPEVKEHYSDAYIIDSPVYTGCMH